MGFNGQKIVFLKIVMLHMKWTGRLAMHIPCSQGAKFLKIDLAQLSSQKKVWLKNYLELPFHNISMHVVQSNCGSRFSGGAILYTYPISTIKYKIATFE